MELDANLVIDKLLVEIQQLTLDKTILEVRLEQLKASLEKEEEGD